MVMKSCVSFLFVFIAYIKRQMNTIKTCFDNTIMDVYNKRGIIIRSIE